MIDDQAQISAVVLAAGKGERLMPLTADRPKACVEVGGIELFARAVDSLRSAGVADITAVTGHRSECLEHYEVKTIFNERYGDANNIYSLWTAQEVVRDGCLIVNSDVIFDPAIAAALVQAKGTVIVCDDTRPTDDEAMKAVTENGNLVTLSKSAVQENCGEYIGLARIDSEHGPQLVEILNGFVDDGNIQVYYEDAIEALAAQVPVTVSSTDGRAWAEIDDHDDLAYAEREVVARLDVISGKR